MLSPAGARMIVDYIDRVGFFYPNDNMLMRLMDWVPAYTTIPHIISLPPSSKDGLHGDNSDVQYDGNRISGGSHRVV